MAQVDDAHRLSRVELALQVLRLKTRGDQLFEHHPAAIEANQNERNDSSNQ